MSRPLRRWITTMAWRDARASRGRILLFTTTVVAGVAALVAIRGFSATLEDAVSAEAKSFLGADLAISARRPFTEQDESLLAEAEGEQLRRIRFGSMAYFPRTQDSRLAEIMGVEPGYPFYGEIETEPPGAAATLGESGSALVDRNLMLQFGARVGDQVRIGQTTFRITGALRRLPGELPVVSVVAPRILVSLGDVDDTGLLTFGSRAVYTALFRWPAPPDELQTWIDERRDRLRSQRLWAETSQRRQERISRLLGNLYLFLNLGALAALLLGALGVASAVHLHIQRKLPQVATLRCLGAPARAALWIFLLQAVAIGLGGSIAGAALGVGVQAALPRVLAAFLPLEISFAWQPLAVGQGLVTGIVVALLFALPPLLAVRRVPPLLALRAAALHESAARPDRLEQIARGLLVVGAVGAAIYQVGDLVQGAAISAVLALALALLAGTAALLRGVARRFLPTRWSYPWRQGVANLYRPGQQTGVVLLSLGFGAFGLMTLLVAQTTLLGAVRELSFDNRIDLVLFGVQPDQTEAVRALLETEGVEIREQVPIVPLRLRRLGDVPVDEISDDEIPRWARRGEYNVTYTGQLRAGEEVVAGAWVAHGPTFDSGEAIPVSFERDIAETLHLELGDELVFDLQGVEIPARVASLRRVDWGEGRPNFYVIFPAGVLEEAPQQNVIVAWAGTSERSVAVQRGVVQGFPSVSLIDLSTVLETVESVLGKVRFAVRFLATFTLAAGLAVLAVALSLSALERLRESVLLRTLGASRRQLRRIISIEFGLLGALSALAALSLAVAAGWALAHWVFETDLVLPLGALALVAGGLTAATIAIGLLSSRPATRRPPLEVLRGEG